MLASGLSPEVETVKTPLKQAWKTDGYDRFSRYLEGSAREFYARLDVAPGSRLLDIGWGSAQLASTAAKDGLDVTSVDIASNPVERARTRAHAKGWMVRLKEGDAEALPFEDASFDVVTSLLGAMFAPWPALVAKELLRVCRPGGVIAMANWTPQGFMGQMFKAISRYVGPSGMPSPLLWGDQATVYERLSKGLSKLNVVRRHFRLSYPFPPSEVVEFFCLYYGPTNRACASLGNRGREHLRQELETLWSAHNRAETGTRVFAEYLEVIGIRSRNVRKERCG